jgi:hypothetical protein
VAVNVVLLPEHIVLVPVIFVGAVVCPNTGITKKTKIKTSNFLNTIAMTLYFDFLHIIDSAYSLNSLCKVISP